MIESPALAPTAGRDLPGRSVAELHYPYADHTHAVEALYKVFTGEIRNKETE